MASGSKSVGSLDARPKQSLPAIIYSNEDPQPADRHLIEQIFLPHKKDLSRLSDGKSLGFHNVAEFLDVGMEKAARKNESYATKNTSDGRLGPPSVVFDVSGSSGTMVIESDRLGVTSRSNFSTIKANNCVFQGKWLFEIMLGSKGVMQMGWCTLACKFSQEEGVGDTDDSYAFDGNRLRKWNAKIPRQYGDLWLVGDIITVSIDCNKGTVSFGRNGQWMGEAFENIKLGQGIAYFPAVSLSLDENLHANFGATPLRYPMDGQYRPLQDPPAIDLVKAQHLFLYFDNLVTMLTTNNTESPQRAEAMGVKCPQSRSKRTTLLLIAAHLFDKLAPLLRNGYVIEEFLLKLLLKYVKTNDDPDDQPDLDLILKLLWSMLQDHEIKVCLENLFHSLLSAYRFTPVDLEYTYQKTILVLVLTILQHENSRKFLLKNVLFDKMKFPLFLLVKPLDDDGLAHIVQTPWWGFVHDDDEDDVSHDKGSAADTEAASAFQSSCKHLHKHVSVLEQIQVKIVKALLSNTDGVKGLTACSRFIFLYKLREFLKEYSPTLPRAQLINLCPPSVSLCFFHRLTQALRQLWDEFASSHPSSAVPSTEAFVPCKKFCDESLNYLEVQRLGGLVSHLKKAYREELHRTLHGSPTSSMPQYKKCIEFGEELLAAQRCLYLDEPDEQEGVSAHSLIELLDIIVMLYNVAAHRQLAKMSTLRENIKEYVNALEDTDKKLKQCPKNLPQVIKELKNAKKVFTEKLTEQTRHMAWVFAIVYAKDKQEDVFWLLKSVLKTLMVSSAEDKLFTFVPDFYVEACTNAYNAIRGYIHPTCKYDSLPDFTGLVQEYATFLSTHFFDDRIVNADVKDSVVQALACVVCYPMSLRALENIPMEYQLRMTKALLSPYENRSWAQTNWILTRLWKGCGFGFRYRHLPHLHPTKNQHREIGSAGLQRPCPSPVFQQHVAVVLRQDQTNATKLIDSLLNQLNWAFSEFIGMLQELQQLASRPVTAYVDSRQLNICATCFDISVGLLRVLEMIVHLMPELFTNWSQPTAELLLCRLFQSIAQILNRVSTKDNTFDMVVNAGIPGMESVDHFPVLAAVTGILVQLLLNGTSKSRECATVALLAEPGFQLDSLEFLLSHVEFKSIGQSPSAIGSKQPFSFTKYKEISEEEIKLVEMLITHMRTQQSRVQPPPECWDCIYTSESDVHRRQILTYKDGPRTGMLSQLGCNIDDDDICNICYARPKSVTFIPCGHESCRSCIAHHLMNHKECFFCKAKVESFTDEQTANVSGV